MSRVSLAFSSFILLSLDHYSLNKRWTVSLHPRLPHRVSTITPSTICGILYWNCFSSSMWMVLSTPISLTSTWPKSHYLVTLFLTYCVTRRRCSSLHDDTLGTTVHTILFLEWHHCHPRDIDIRNDFKVEAHILAVWFRALMRYPNTRLPSTGILISLDDANLTCIVTIANAYDFATTSVPPWRVFQVWCRTHLWVSTRDPWWMWNCTCSEERSVFLFTDSYRWFSSCTRSRPTLVVLSARARPQVFLFTRRGSVGEALHCCLGEIHLHSWSFIVLRHGGHVHRDFFGFLFTRFAVSLSSSNLFFSSSDASFDPLSWLVRDLIKRTSIVLCPSERVSLMSTHSSKESVFQGLFDWGSTSQTFWSSLWAFPSLVFASVGVASLPPGFHKLLSVTVTTCRFYLLDVLFSVATTFACCPCHLVRVTSTIAVGRVVGDLCQAIAAEACTLFNYALWFSAKCGWSLFCPVLLSCQRVSCSTIPVFSAWHCVLPLQSVVATGFLWHAGGWHFRKRPCVRVHSFSFFSIFSAPVDFCKVIRAAIEWILFKRRWKVKDLQLRKIVFWDLPHSRCLCRTRPLILERLSALKNHDVLLRCGLEPLF